MKLSTSRRRLLGVLFLTTSLLAAGPTSAVGNCTFDPYMPYGANWNYHAWPAVAIVPSQPFTTGVGCFNQKRHLNYAGSAVSHTVANPQPSFAGWPTCSRMRTRVMNGSFQLSSWSGSSWQNQNNHVQADLPGNVLLADYKMYSLYGNRTDWLSWAGDTDCIDV